jgi:hypothetical protein
MRGIVALVGGGAVSPAAVRRSMTKRDSFLLLLVPVLLLLLACSRHEVTRAEWERLDQPGKVLLVRSFIGGEQAMSSKGGRGGQYSQPPESYAAEIDRRYAAGDQRLVNDLWAEMSDPEQGE